jgi:hypothetical protein
MYHNYIQRCFVLFRTFRLSETYRALKHMAKKRVKCLTISKKSDHLKNIHVRKKYFKVYHYGDHEIVVITIITEQLCFLQ